MSNPEIRINFIGCGRVGQTLAGLWRRAAGVTVGDILTRSLASAKTAVDFIGAGNPLRRIGDMQAADAYLVGCSDNHIEACCDQLADTGLLRRGNVVFHCSGALGSAALHSARAGGAFIASAHPVKSFADPAASMTGFANTYCGIEGDPPALQRIAALFECIGGITFVLDADQKPTYHAASVIACNYLVALEECSLTAFEHAGVARDLAMKILRPIVEGTVHNIFALGTAQALTGPIARGDHSVVETQLAALEARNPELAEVYRVLGRQALALSRRQGKADRNDLERLQEALKRNATPPLK